MLAFLLHNVFTQFPGRSKEELLQTFFTDNVQMKWLEKLKNRDEFKFVKRINPSTTKIIEAAFQRGAETCELIKNQRAQLDDLFNPLNFRAE